MRKSYIQLPDNRLVEKGSPEHAAYLEETAKRRAPAIARDEPPFISPIDGKEYSGRAGMREHNRRHDVINNRDLVGLPYETVRREPVPDRKGVTQALVDTMKRKGYL